MNYTSINLEKREKTLGILMQKKDHAFRALALNPRDCAGLTPRVSVPVEGTHRAMQCATCVAVYDGLESHFPGRNDPMEVAGLRATVSCRGGPFLPLPVSVTGFWENQVTQGGIFQDLLKLHTILSSSFSEMN